MSTHVATIVLDEMVRISVEEVDPDRIILFGSHARGDATIHSDVDLLVVVPGEFGPSVSRRLIIARILKRMIGLPVSKDILLFTHSEWKHAGGGIIRTASEEGQILYERSADSESHD
jgi:predicted nucleotidyltransferase